MWEIQTYWISLTKIWYCSLMFPLTWTHLPAEKLPFGSTFKLQLIACIYYNHLYISTKSIILLSFLNERSSFYTSINATCYRVYHLVLFLFWVPKKGLRAVFLFFIFDGALLSSDHFLTQRGSKCWENHYNGFLSLNGRPFCH